MLDGQNKHEFLLARLTWKVDQSLTANSGLARDYLMSGRRLDFWMLGGASIVFWAPLFVFQSYFSEVERFTYYMSWVAFYLAYLVNYPHFIASYKFAYVQGRKFITDNAFQLLVVPVMVFGVLLYAFSNWGELTQYSRIVEGINNVFSGLGLDTRLGQHKFLGPELMSLLVNFMFLTVGWHYAKQAFGCAMVYARYDGYPLATAERNIIRYSLLSTWWVTWLNINCLAGSYKFYGLTIYRLNLPELWLQASYTLFFVLWLAVIYILGVRYRQSGVLPSRNFLVPMLALLVWHIPLFSNPQYYYFLAFFHSLQYLPFVARREMHIVQRTATENHAWRMAIFIGALLCLGYVCFDLAPNSLDAVAASYQNYGASVFMIAFLVFINIHHYFIDNVLWRFKHKEVRVLLLNE